MIFGFEVVSAPKSQSTLYSIQKRKYTRSETDTAQTRSKEIGGQ